MVIKFVKEPELEFARQGRSPDIREGISKYGPIDFDTPRAKREINLGIVGTPKTIDSFQRWFEKCWQGIKGIDARNPNMNPNFPGLDSSIGFRARFNIDDTWIAKLSERDLADICHEKAYIQRLSEIFHKEIRRIHHDLSTHPDVVICLPPEIVRRRVRPDISEGDEFEDIENPDCPLDFHDYLKGLCLTSYSKSQLIWPHTYEEGKRAMQDEATRAWNLFGALFYKAGGIPWKLLQTPGKQRTCYIGIAFSKRGDGSYMYTSLIQVFNDRGEGTILKGELAHQSPHDKEVHLSYESAKRLLQSAIRNFSSANADILPDRIVIHKTSGFDSPETSGFNAALTESKIKFCDMMALNSSEIRLFREGAYPPLRGVHLIFDEKQSILYTRGSVPFYRKYPGAYVPLSLQIRCFQTESPHDEIANEILALTKLNWNKTQFDSFYPITLEGARNIGSIYKVCSDPPSKPISYAYFM
jgi:hypothetical protein